MSVIPPKTPRLDPTEYPAQHQDVDPYWSLRKVLDAAYEQAAYGKGAERHARGNPFEEQHMQTISRLLGSERGMAYQAIKKLTEGLDLPDRPAQIKELLGAINYIAGIVVYWQGEDAKNGCYKGTTPTKMVKES